MKLPMDGELLDCNNLKVSTLKSSEQLPSHNAIANIYFFYFCNLLKNKKDILHFFYLK